MKRDGLYPKYRVKKLKDDNGKHTDCWYFVLDPKHDPLAREALLTYANEARKIGLSVLADQLESKTNGP